MHAGFVPYAELNTFLCDAYHERQSGAAFAAVLSRLQRQRCSTCVPRAAQGRRPQNLLGHPRASPCRCHRADPELPRRAAGDAAVRALPPRRHCVDARLPLQGRRRPCATPLRGRQLRRRRHGRSRRGPVCADPRLGAPLRLPPHSRSCVGVLSGRFWLEPGPPWLGSAAIDLGSCLHAFMVQQPLCAGCRGVAGAATEVRHGEAEQRPYAGS